MFNPSRSRSMTFVGNGMASTSTPPPTRRRASVVTPSPSSAFAETSARFQSSPTSGPRRCPVCDRVFTNASPSSTLLFNKHIENCTLRNQTSLSIDAMTSRHRRVNSAAANRSLSNSTSSASSSFDRSYSSSSSILSSSRSSRSFDERNECFSAEQGLGNLHPDIRHMFTVELEAVGSASEFGGFGKKEIPYELQDDEELRKPMKPPTARRLTLLGRAGKRRRLTGDVVGAETATPITPTAPVMT